MWPADQYQLMDFGQGRKLERFGHFVLDRPSPAAQSYPMRDAALWRQATHRLDENSHSSSSEPGTGVGPWKVQYESVRFGLRVTPFGHVGLFPEHEQHWQWLRQLQFNSGSQGEPSLLNLFAYTGGATLVLAAAGWQVTHVDSSAPTVAWARANAEASHLQGAPIRWLVEDARDFAARELRRGRRYRALILDPPSYGHGPKGKAWSIQRDLPGLLTICCQLLAPGGALLLTGHSSQLPIAKEQLAALLQANGHLEFEIASGRTTLNDRANRPLDFGWYLRVH